MKKLSTILLIVGVLFFSGNAMALSLYDITGISGTEEYYDTGAEAAVLTDTDGTNDDATAFLLLELAGFENTNKFGIYGYTIGDNGEVISGETLEIFSGADSSMYDDNGNLQTLAATTILKFDLYSGTVSISDGDDYTVANIGTTFGFYLTTTEGSGYTYYSHASLNDDGYDHMLIFDTSDDSVSALNGSDIVIAIEDLYGGGDNDYNDMVVGITDVAPVPVPEPATMLLLGTGLIGLVGMSRKKMFGK